MVDLPARSSVPLLSENVNFGAVSGNVNFGAVSGSDFDSACTGNINAPTAPPGKVCMYIGSALRVANAQGLGLKSFSGGLGPPEDRAFYVAFDILKGFDSLGTISEPVSLYIRWAYTAP